MPRVKEMDDGPDAPMGRVDRVNKTVILNSTSPVIVAITGNRDAELSVLAEIIANAAKEGPVLGYDEQDDFQSILQILTEQFSNE